MPTKIENMATRNWRYTADDLPRLSPFGSVLAERMPIARFHDGRWSEAKLIPLDEFALHPGAHGIHYGSSCFEGLKAYRWPDDSLVIFRAQQHAKRMGKSAATLCLPIPDVAMLTQMMADAVLAAAEQVPPAPGSLYLRPVLIGTDMNIGAASASSKSAYLYVLASPVGDYFAGGESALRLLVEDERLRTTPQFGAVKTGANYAAALGMTLDAKAAHNVDQILFCPQGDVQETGASNFVLIDDKSVITKPLCGNFLHGVTRDCVLYLARDLGYEVQERDISVDELLAWTGHGEAALAGTAAGLSGVGTIICRGEQHTLTDGKTGPNTRRIRQALMDTQQGVRPDTYGWLTKVA
jgi:branched-chain amino acid aminotransferase